MYVLTGQPLASGEFHFMEELRNISFSLFLMTGWTGEAVKNTTSLKTFSSRFLYFILLTWLFSQVFELNCIICGYSEILNWSFINWLVKKLLMEYKLAGLGWLTQGLNNGTVQSSFLPPCPRTLSSTLPYRVHVQGSNTYIP